MLNANYTSHFLVVSLMVTAVVASSAILAVGNAGMAYADNSHVPLESMMKIDFEAINATADNSFGVSASDIGDPDGDGGTEIIIGALGTTSVYFTFTSTNQNPIQLVEIGALVPLTKNAQPNRAGDHRAFAVNTAVSDFNNYLQENGLSWALDVDLRDTKGLPATTLAEASDMHGNEGISFIVGPSFSSNVGTIITDYIEPNSADLVLVSPSSTSPTWAEIDTVYRLAISDTKQGQVIADLLYQDGKRVVIPVWADDAFGRGLAEVTTGKFTELGGVADYAKDPANGTVRSYDRCSETYTTCIDDQFPEMVSELAGTVTDYIRLYGSDKVAVVFIGFELSDFAAEAASNHPILRTVQWLGTDADILDPKLVVDGSQTMDFLVDVNFRTSIFSGSEDTDRYDSLAKRFASEFPGETPSVYAYSSYDTVWAVGLAMEAAGGPDSSFADIEAEIGPAVDGNDEGALGDITLNKYGDIESGDYAVWGIEPTGWERIGTYRSDGALAKVYEDPDVVTIGALLSLGGADGVPPSASVFLDDEFAVSMALSELDFNKNNPDMQVDVRTIDTSLGPLSTITGLHTGTYDYFYEPQLLRLIDDAADRYDDDGNFDSLNGQFPGHPTYPFAFDSEGIFDFHGSSSFFKGHHITDRVLSSDRVSVEEVFDLLAPQDTGDDPWQPPDQIWAQSIVAHPLTGANLTVRSLLTYHEPSGLILGASYFSPAGGDETHAPYLTAVINSAVERIKFNNNDIDSLVGTYDGISSPFYAFVLDTDGEVLATSLTPTPGSDKIGENITDIRDSDMTIDQINDTLLADGNTVWKGYTFNNPVTGLEEAKRALLMQVTLDGIEYIFGSGYYLPDLITNFVGPTTSASLTAIQDHINDGSFVTISPSSTSTTLSQDDSVFRLSPNIGAQVPTIAGLIESGGNTHIVIIQRDVWADYIVSKFTEDDRFASYVVVEPKLPEDPTDFDYSDAATALESAVSGAIAAAGSDSVAVLHATFPADLVALLNAVDANLDTTSPVFSVDHYSTDAIVDVSGVTDDPVAGRVAYDLGITGPLFSPSPNPTNILLADRLGDLGITYNAYHSSAYDSVSLLADSILLSSEQYLVRDVLNSSSQSGVMSPFPYLGALDGTGGITLDDSGDLSVGQFDYITYKVTSSGSQPDVTYSWQPLGTTVSGTVFSDTNGNGVKDANETGIEGYRMLAIDYSDINNVMEAYTTSDGTYSFDIAPSPATTLVQTSLYPQGHTLSSDDWYMYLTPEEDSTTQFDVGFYPVPAAERVTLDITVYKDDNLNGVMDPGESPIGDVRGLYVYTYTVGQVAAPIPGADGSATVSDLVPADFALFVLADQLADDHGYIWATTSYTRNDSITVDNPAIPIAVNPTPGSVHTVMVGLAP